MDYQATDEDGITHIGWWQERNFSCGPACIYMVESALRAASLSGGERRIRTLMTDHFSDSLPELVLNTQDDFGTRGTSIGRLLRALRAEGWKCKPQTDLPFPWTQAVLPMIAHITWADGGGHFVAVMRTTTLNKAVVLDPWFGLQQVPVGSLPSYNARPSPHARGRSRQGGCFSGLHIQVQGRGRLL